jgi:hypothetical protein
MFALYGFKQADIKLLVDMYEKRSIPFSNQGLSGG